MALVDSWVTRGESQGFLNRGSAYELEYGGRENAYKSAPKRGLGRSKKTVRRIIWFKAGALP